MAIKDLDKENKIAVMMGIAKVIAFPEEEFQLTLPLTEVEQVDIKRAYQLGKELGAKALTVRSKDV